MNYLMTFTPRNPLIEPLESVQSEGDYSNQGFRVINLSYMGETYKMSIPDNPRSIGNFMRMEEVDARLLKTGEINIIPGKAHIAALPL